MLKGTVETAQNPLGAAAGEIKSAVDSPSPAYYLGAKASDGAFALPGMLSAGREPPVKQGFPRTRSPKVVLLCPSCAAGPLRAE